MTDIKCIMRQVHGSSLSPHSSSHHQASWTKLHLLRTSNKTVFSFLTLPHLLESLPLCCNQLVGILLNSAKPIQAKPLKKTLNDPGRQQSVKHSVTQLPYWPYNPKVALCPTHLFSLEGLLQFSSQRLPVKKLEVRLDYITSQLSRSRPHYQWGLSAPIHTKCF